MDNNTEVKQMKQEYKLAITSPSEQELLKAAIKFFYGSNIRFEGEQVFNAKGLMPDWRVVKKGSRYRLECKV
jgi:hypothetical protein